MLLLRIQYGLAVKPLFKYAIGMTIREYIEKHKLTQQQFADLVVEDLCVHILQHPSELCL